MHSRGGGGVVACQMLLLVSCFMSAFHSARGRISSQCVQLGQTAWYSTSTYLTYTIGAKNFTIYSIQTLGTAYQAANPKLWPYSTCFRQEIKSTNPDIIDFCPQNVDIEAYLVRQNNRTLRGWLHIVIKLNWRADSTDEMDFIYIQFRDEHFSAMGEFITDPAHQCENPDPEKLVQPTQYQVYPCGATGDREEKTATAAFVAKHEQYTNSYVRDMKYVTQKDLTRGIHFTWRLSEYWCSRHERFRVDAKLKLKGKSKALRKVADFWLTPKWYGAADIVVEGEPLDCSIPAINYKTGDVSAEALNWIEPVATPLYFINDFLNPATDQNERITGCQLYPISSDSDNYIKAGRDDSTVPTFGGRCRDYKDKSPNQNKEHNCNDDKSSALAGLNFTTYKEYTAIITAGRLKQCNQTCVHPDPKNETHLKEITAFNKTIITGPIPKPQISLQTLREARAESRNTTFWQTRKFHGNLCVFVVMFLIPLSNFLARYYKETFMVNHYAVPAWLWSHGSTGYFALTLFRCSYTAMKDNINNWGQSTSSAGTMHRYLGYTFIVIFTVMSFIGGVRVLQNKLRVISVMVHAVTGFLLYFMAIYLVISSQYIPGSPSARCNETTKLPEGNSDTAIYAYVWLGLDILFHILMTVWQIMLDRREQIRRPGLLIAFPFVPVVQPEHRRNFVGAGFRKIVLIIYATVSLTMTFLIIGGMFINDDHLSCDLGDLTCNDTENPFGCSPISKKYFNIVVTERYNVTDFNFN